MKESALFDSSVCLTKSKGAPGICGIIQARRLATHIYLLQEMPDSLRDQRAVITHYKPRPREILHSGVRSSDLIPRKEKLARQCLSMSRT